jgi:hypothetical protein
MLTPSRKRHTGLGAFVVRGAKNRRGTWFDGESLVVVAHSVEPDLVPRTQPQDLAQAQITAQLTLTQRKTYKIIIQHGRTLCQSSRKTYDFTDNLDASVIYFYNYDYGSPTHMPLTWNSSRG